MLNSLFRAVQALGGSRTQYVKHATPDDARSILDIGCHQGWMLSELSSQATRLVGVDMDEKALHEARRNFPHIEFVHQTGAQLPFTNEEFDVVILADVIEHVGDENKQAVVDEAHRVLKKDGTLILTVPHQGVSAWMDPMDVKRRVPLIYGIYSRLAKYEPSTAMEIGHKHVSLAELQQLFHERFRFENILFCGIATPLFCWMLSVGPRLKLMPKIIEQNLNRFRAWESGVKAPDWLAYNIRVTAKKLAR